MRTNFCVISFNRSRDIPSQKFWKTCDCSAPYQATKSKIISMLSLKVYCMQNSVRFHAIEPKIEQSEEMWEKRNSSAPFWAICTQIAAFLSLMIDILYVSFNAISSNRNRGEGIPKFPKKMYLQRRLLNDFHQKLIDTNLCLDNTKRIISLNSVHYFSSYTCHKIFVTHTHTHRHFPEIVKSCSGHPKPCKSTKNRKTKIYTKLILSSIYIVESKNELNAKITLVFCYSNIC